MKVMMDEGEPTLDTAGTGDCFYERNGSIVVRQSVTPLQPSTIAKRNEVNGVVRGMKFFGNQLSPGQQAAMFAAAGGGDAALGEIAGILSSIYEGDVPDLPTEILVAEAPTPTIGSPVVCPASSSISVALSLASPIGDEKGILMLSRPISRGAMPRLTDLRKVASGFSFPVIMDVGTSYISKFGFIPPAGTMLMAASAVSASGGSSSPFALSLVPIVCGGGFVFSPERPVFSIQLVGFGTASITCHDESGLTTTFSVSATMPGGITFVGPSSCNDGEATDFSVLQVTAPPGDYTCVLRFTSDQTSAVDELECDIHIEDVPP